MSEPVRRAVEQHILDDIYVAMFDAYDRLKTGNTNLRRCLNYLENEHGYLPPAKTTQTETN